MRAKVGVAFVANAYTDKLGGPAVAGGNRPTYLAVSSAGHIHVEDELSLTLGAVGPRWAAGGDGWKSGVNAGKQQLRRPRQRAAACQQVLRGYEKVAIAAVFLGLGCVNNAYFTRQTFMQCLSGFSFQDI